jgi:hypothetical protein
MMTVSITKLRISTLSILTFGIATLSLMCLIVTLGTTTLSQLNDLRIMTHSLT